MTTRIIEISNKEVRGSRLLVNTTYNEYSDTGEYIRTLDASQNAFEVGTSDADILEWIRVNDYKQELYKDLERTEDVRTYIEEKRDGYVRYVNTAGKRWEVIGTCIGIGTCYEGAVSPPPTLDCPITETFQDNCCPFTINVIEHGN